MERYFPIYFREWDAVLKVATSEQFTEVFVRAYSYAKGEPVEPTDDPVIQALYNLVIGSINNGIEKANRKARSTRYSRYCGVCKSKGKKPLSFADWAEQIDGVNNTDERQQTSTHDNTSQDSSTTAKNADNHNPNSINHNPNHNGYNLTILKDNLKSTDEKISDCGEGPKEHLPFAWETKIPKVYWGRFADEDEYYEYAAEHSEEVLAEIEKGK